MVTDEMKTTVKKVLEELKIPNPDLEFFKEDIWTSINAGRANRRILSGAVSNSIDRMKVLIDYFFNSYDNLHPSLLVRVYPTGDIVLMGYTPAGTKFSYGSDFIKSLSDVNDISRIMSDDKDKVSYNLKEMILCGRVNLPSWREALEQQGGQYRLSIDTWVNLDGRGRVITQLVIEQITTVHVPIKHA